MVERLSALKSCYSTLFCGHWCTEWLKKMRIALKSPRYHVFQGIAMRSRVSSWCILRAAVSRRSVVRVKALPFPYRRRNSSTSSFRILLFVFSESLQITYALSCGQVLLNPCPPQCSWELPLTLICRKRSPWNHEVGLVRLWSFSYLVYRSVLNRLKWFCSVVSKFLEEPNGNVVRFEFLLISLSSAVLSRAFMNFVMRLAIFVRVRRCFFRFGILSQFVLEEIVCQRQYSLTWSFRIFTVTVVVCW